MEFIDLKTPLARNRAAIQARIDAVLDHGRFINGPEIGELEARLAERCGAAHCIAVSSGTMALEIALRALGVGPDDEVVTTPFTWISTAETIALVGARPVFADIDPPTYNIDPECVEAAITPRTKAIIPVDLFGQMADYPAIEAIAGRHAIPIVADAAQSFGARQGERCAGAVGRVACTSFFPAKPLGCYGDGGALFTDDAHLAEDLRAIANHGALQRDHHKLVGTNGRFDTLQAAILLANLTVFDEELEQRATIAARYAESLRGVVRDVPETAPGNTHIHAQYTIRSHDRDRLAADLREEGIPTAVYYPRCVHQQPAFHYLGRAEGDLPEAEAAARDVLSLPFHPYLDTPAQHRVIEAVARLERSG